MAAVLWSLGLAACLPGALAHRGRPRSDPAPQSALQVGGAGVAGSGAESFVFRAAGVKAKLKLAEIDAGGVNVSLCVPCVPEDLATLRDVLMPSVREQTHPPAEVIVSLSSTGDQEARRLGEELRRLSPSLPVRVLNKAGPAPAGENRNRAARASRSGVVAFVDADDAMHPRRLEVMAHVFRTIRPRVALHGYSKGTSEVAPLPDEFEVLYGSQIYNSGLGMLGSQTYAVHQGQPTLDRRVFEGVQQRELPRGQDVRFLNDVLERYGPREDTIVYVGLPLTRFSNWATGR